MRVTVDVGASADVDLDQDASDAAAVSTAVPASFVMHMIVGLAREPEYESRSRS
jgi:hypothetical protein